MKLGFIGGGVMAEAIIAGLLDSDLEAQISVGEPVAARREALSKHDGLSVSESNNEAIAGADIAVLAIKPQQFDSVAESLSSVLSPEQTVLSIMAGVKIHSIGLKLNHRRLIRVMPNTPMQVRQGISAWTATEEVPADVIDFTGKMLKSLGDELKFSDERYVDIATALSASGPGYVFMFMESLADAGVKLGLPVHVARTPGAADSARKRCACQRNEKASGGVAEHGDVSGWHHCGWTARSGRRQLQVDRDQRS